MPLSTPPTDAPKPPRTYKTRRTEGEVALFGGQLVNAKKLARDCLNNAPLNAVRRLVQAGMPVVRLPGSQRRWFDPVRCLEWFRAHQLELNQPRPTKDATQQTRPQRIKAR